jgi:hypothetical protein
MQKDGGEEKGYELNEYKKGRIAALKAIGLCIIRNRLEAVSSKIKND